MSEMKTCTLCGDEYPGTSEFFSPVKRKNGVKLINQCRKCINSKGLKHYHDVTKKDPDKMEKLREYSRVRGAMEERKEYLAVYKIENRVRIRELNKALEKKNPEKTREIKQRWVINNKSEKNETCRRYRTNNVEKVKETNRVYRQTEQGKKAGRMGSQRRLARVRSLPATFTNEQWEDCKNHFGNACCYCGEREEDNEQGFVLEQDHFIALNNKGPYTKENVVSSCKSCNISKYDHFFFNWYRTRPYYSLERENRILEYLNTQSKPIQQLSFAI
jgi:hypothetical protein